MEANELLALLANLGAQQQAVLAAIAGKHQGSQRAADRRQPEGMAFPSSLSSMPISRPVVKHQCCRRRVSSSSPATEA